jgi:hypothetical protein
MNGSTNRVWGLAGSGLATAGILTGFGVTNPWLCIIIGGLSVISGQFMVSKWDDR